MLKRFGILFIPACATWAAAITIFITACSKSGGGGEEHENASIRLFLGKLEVPMFDSISVHISAADMANIHIVEKTTKDNLRIDGIPQGENRKFEIKIYADSGKLVQSGDATADIKAGETVNIPIFLNTMQGFLKLEIPLGIQNTSGISSGKLFLNSLVLNMKIENGKGIFSTGAFPLNETIALRIELKNSNGDILFFGQKQITLSSILQTETMQLQPTTGSAVLELQASSEGPAQILAMLPESEYGFRTPKNFGDLFFTEIFTDPADGDHFQYIELYNITLDTLQLADCKIARNREYTGTNGRLILKELLLPPMEYIVLGRMSVVNANYNYGSFTLLKTEQSLGFFCGDLAIDTLTYFNKGDNIFPMSKGSAMQLPLENYKNRAIGSSWCFGFSPKSNAICR